MEERTEDREEIKQLRESVDSWKGLFDNTMLEVGRLNAIAMSEKLDQVKSLHKDLAQAEAKANLLQRVLDERTQRLQHSQDREHVLVREVNRLRKVVLETVPVSPVTKSPPTSSLDRVHEAINLALANAQALQDAAEHPSVDITEAWTRCAEALVLTMRLEHDLSPEVPAGVDNDRGEG